MSATALKLTIELVPETCWYSNLREQIKSTDWKRISAETRSAGMCAVCGVSGVRLACHERWEYDDQRGIQRLRGFVALCDSCHAVKHIGHTGVVAVRAGRPELLEDAIGHFMRVNRVDLEAFNAHKTEAFAVWRQRSARCRWRQTP